MTVTLESLQAIPLTATALMPFGEVPPRILREDRFEGGVDTHLNAMAELSATVAGAEGKSKL